jgi:adenylylsulfate kinase-like enzyme/tetratricopeptide (TPR) repeat protein
MNEELRRRYVRDLIADLGQVGGARLEQWIKPLWDHLAGGPVNARGLNPQGAPVAGALDATWPDGSVSEASSDAGYFKSPYDKPTHDFRHVLKEAPGVRTVRLFATETAGPKASTLAERVKQRLARRGYHLDLWDGRRIAEYIVDRLLTDERFVTRVGDALPNLRRISEQNAASARVPELDPLYGGRGDEEDDAIARMSTGKVVVLFGFGGIGKTELACAVAHRVRDKYELVVWADGDRIASLDNLRAYDVRLNGYKLNLLDLLASHKTLLVLDNISIDLDTEALVALCGADSRILITSQVEFGQDIVPLGFVGRERAREILSAGIATPCPDDVLDAVLRAVEGHPLVLRMLNRLAAQGRDWPVVERQCLHIAGAADEKRRTVAARILEQHLDVLGPELAFFAWCGSAAIDSGLFEHLFGIVGLDKLQRWALTARGQSDAVRLHDIVYASVGRFRDRLPGGGAFEEQLEAYISTQLAPKRLEFFRVVNRHRALIEAQLTADPRPGALRYAYLHGHAPARLDPALMGDPAADALAGQRGDARAWLLSIVEAIEADYRRVRDLGNKPAAKTALEARLPTFDLLVGDPRLSDDTRSIARHHRAKSLLKLGRVAEALQAFEALVAEHADQFAAKLQVARLSESDPERAKNLIFEIIAAEQAKAGSVATSVLIETLATLRRQHLRRFVPEMTDRFGPFMAQQIKAAACSGEDQPIRAFAGVGPEWSYKAPDLFLEVLEAIDLGAPEDAEDDDERIAIGRLLTAAGKMLLRQGAPGEAQLRFQQSERFFSAVNKRSGFACTHHADALLRLGRDADAASVLEQAPDHQREAFWLLRRSEAHSAAGELDDALARINEALAKTTLEERRPTFLAQRADILLAKGDATHEADLREAIRLCEDPQYRGDLEAKLAQRVPSA